MQRNQFLNEIHSHRGVLRKDFADAGAEMRGLVHLRQSRCELGFGLLFEGSESGCADEEGTHVVAAVGVGVDVFEAVAWCCEVLLAVVVADEIHDCQRSQQGRRRGMRSDERRTRVLQTLDLEFRRQHIQAQIVCKTVEVMGSRKRLLSSKPMLKQRHGELVQVIELLHSSHTTIMSRLFNKQLLEERALLL